MATFAFVPGAFHGGWSFDLVRPLLKEQIHRVLAPTLSDVGERAHLAAVGPIDLDTHILDIANLIEWHDLRDVVLAGHSYAGMVITGVADRIADRIAALVYLEAAIPEDGDTLFSILPVLLAPFTANAASLAGRSVAPLPAAAFGVAPEFHEWVDAKLTTHPLGCFTQAIGLVGAYRNVPKRVLVYNRRDIGIPIPYPEQYEALRTVDGCHVLALPVGHDLMIDGAEELAAFLLAHC